MRKLISLALTIVGALFCTAQNARAQSPVNVTATVKDSSAIPYSNATVSILLLPIGGATVGGNQILTTNNGLLDSSGKLNVSLYKNSDISPGGSTWQFTICETPGIAPPLGTGGVCFTSTQTVSAAVDFSTQFQAAAKALTTIPIGSGGGTVTNVSASAPITSTGGATPTIACATCNTSSATIAGSIANTQVAVGSAANTIGGNANFTYNSGTGGVTLNGTGVSSNNLILGNTGGPSTMTFQVTAAGGGAIQDQTGATYSFGGAGALVAQDSSAKSVLLLSPGFASSLLAGTGSVGPLNNSAGAFTVNSNGSFTQSGGVYTTDINPSALTWTTNAGGVTFNGVQWNLTDTASSAASNVFQIFGGAASTTNLFKLTKGGNLTLPGSITGTTLNTTTNCAGVGTAANPSVATCVSASAGHFSCATNATGGTCQVNTTAVTANSEIFVFESDTAATGTALSVTCNTGTNVLPASRLLASSVAGASFTINLGTVTTNPACFSYRIVN